jgi:nitrogen fixation protein FixH
MAEHDTDIEEAGAWRWPAMIIGLLVANALGCAVVIWIAVSDPSHMIEPGYDQAALRWDERKAARQRSDELGWKCLVSLGGAADVMGRRALTISLHDHEGRPVGGADVEVTVFHHARANDRASLTLAPGAEGTYTAPASMGRAGLWEVRVRARRDADRFIFDQILELDDGGAIIG